MGNLCFREDNTNETCFGYDECIEEYKEEYKEESKNDYIFYENMDDNNKKAMDIWQAGGVDAAIKHMTIGADGQPRSYAEIRQMYG